MCAHAQCTRIVRDERHRTQTKKTAIESDNVNLIVLFVACQSHSQWSRKKERIKLTQGSKGGERGENKSRCVRVLPEMK